MILLQATSVKDRMCRHTTCPAATPKNTAALAIAFLVVPPTFPDTRERPTTKVALEAPVIPVVHYQPVTRDGNCHVQNPARRVAVFFPQATMANPATVGMLVATINQVRLPNGRRLLTKIVTRMNRTMTAPYGICMRVVVRVSNPNPLTIKVPLYTVRSSYIHLSDSH